MSCRRDALADQGDFGVETRSMFENVERLGENEIDACIAWLLEVFDLASGDEVMG